MTCVCFSRIPGGAINYPVCNAGNVMTDDPRLTTCGECLRDMMRAVVKERKTDRDKSKQFGYFGLLTKQPGDPAAQINIDANLIISEFIKTFPELASNI